MSEELSRKDLVEWAEELDAMNSPYSSQVQAENQFFVSQLENREGDELSDIRDKALQDNSKCQSESKKWKHVGWGTIAAGIGLNVVTGGTVGLVALVGGFAGMMYGSSRSTKEEQRAMEAEHFVIQLDDVADAISRTSENNIEAEADS